MTILLDPPNADSLTFELDHLLQTAIAALHGYLIRIRGAARSDDGTAAILLASEADQEIASPLLGTSASMPLQPPV